VIDALTLKRADDIKLSGHPESFQLEQHGDRMFVNVPDAQEIAVVSRVLGKVVGRWPMKEFRSNFPLALDEANHRLFVGCRSPARLVVLDTQTGRTIANFEIDGDTDDLFYDSASGQLYVSCGAGFVDVFSGRNLAGFKLQDRVVTSRGARTAFFSQDLGELYVAVPLRGEQLAEIRVWKTP
jgi:hypothetical protein